MTVLCLALVVADHAEPARSVAAGLRGLPTGAARARRQHQGHQRVGLLHLGVRGRHRRCAARRRTGGAGAVSFDFTISLTLIAVLAASTLFTLGADRRSSTAIVGAFLFVVLKVYITDDFFVKYQGVGFGLVALGVACVPG